MGKGDEAPVTPSDGYPVLLGPGYGASPSLALKTFCRRLFIVITL